MHNNNSTFPQILEASKNCPPSACRSLLGRAKMNIECDQINFDARLSRTELNRSGGEEMWARKQDIFVFFCGIQNAEKTPFILAEK